MSTFLIGLGIYVAISIVATILVIRIGTAMQQGKGDDDDGQA